MVEFPKALYRAGECLVAADAAQEAEAREQGFSFWSDAPAGDLQSAAPDAAAAEVPDVPPAPRRGRPPKGAQ